MRYLGLRQGPLKGLIISVTGKLLFSVFLFNVQRSIIKCQNISGWPLRAPTTYTLSLEECCQALNVQIVDVGSGVIVTVAIHIVFQQAIDTIDS